MPKYHSLRGMPDIPPEDAATFQWVEDKAREIYRIYEYRQIRTPILEETEVFTRSIGEDTDIVQKEMYSFTDRGGKNVSLRPEGTAPIVRAYIEHGWHKDQDVVKLFSMGPMFRGERPQKGRLRQFHQIGAEIIGASNPYIDAELILNLKAVLENLKVPGFKIQLNSIGCGKDREVYKKELAAFFKGKEAKLCENCSRRIKTNILRVLDCKVEGCRKVIEKAPRVTDHLCGDCQTYYSTVKSILKEMNVDFVEKPDMVRGLDYYTGTVFEVSHPALGAQDAVAAGGRYDDLTREMGGPKVGATGYAIGVERLLMALDKKNIPPDEAGVLIVTVDEASKLEAVKLIDKLRKKGVKCDMDHSGRSLKGGMRKANREKRRYVVILGEDEVKSGKVTLKDMETGEQQQCSQEELIKKI